MKITTAIVSLFLTSFISLKCQNVQLDQPEHLLDGYSFTYQYQNGEAIHITFDDGKLTYKWIEGRRQTNPTKTFPYLSRQIDDGIYLVNWHEIEEKNFITLVFNLSNRVASSSVLVRYGNEEPIIAFQGGIIEHMERK